MNIKINLTNNYGKLEERLPFFIADNEKLSLTFFSDVALKDVFFEATNGDTYIKHRLSYLTTIEIPDKLVKVGQLKIAISLIARGEIVKTYEVEPIEIKDENNAFTGFLPVEQAIADYNELKAKYDELLALTKEHESKLKQIFDLIEQGEM